LIFIGAVGGHGIAFCVEVLGMERVAKARLAKVRRD
jgi:hypothetical protein